MKRITVLPIGRRSIRTFLAVVIVVLISGCSDGGSPKAPATHLDSAKVAAIMADTKNPRNFKGAIRQRMLQGAGQVLLDKSAPPKKSKLKQKAH
jgi:hypothetical protein